MPRKMVALERNSRELELWQKAEAKARQEMGSSAREGEVLARICAEYLNEEPPFPEVEA
jgi:hypothetical protein